MSEKKLFCFMSIEGILLLILGFCILILPKLTSLSFHVMVSSAFIIYGIYKFINAIINKHLFNHIVCEMLLGVFLTVIGILLLFIPKINIFWLIAFIGIYFILESILSLMFAEQIKNILKFSCGNFIAAIIMFLSGLAILISLPELSFVSVAILTGICFIAKGMVKNATSIINRNNYEALTTIREE